PAVLQGGVVGSLRAAASRNAARMTAAPTELPETVDSAKMRLRMSPYGAPRSLSRPRSISAPTTVAVIKPARLAPPAPAMRMGPGQARPSGPHLLANLPRPAAS